MQKTSFVSQATPTRANTSAKALVFAQFLKFQNTKTYDFLAALPLGAFYIYSVTHIYPIVVEQIQWLISTVQSGAEPITIAFVTNLAIGLALLINLGVFLVILLVRRKPVARSQGLRAYVTAIYGTYLSYIITQMEPKDPSRFLEIASVVLVLLGITITIYSIIYLGRSFSILPEARKLVTTGAYSWVRHPLYLGELMTLSGLTLHHLSITAVALLLLIFYFQLERMKFEEKILGEVFPEYANYKRSTYRILPWVY